jgi:DNA-binding transcriptional LysR family regulator
MHELKDTPLVLYPTGARPSFIDQVHEMCRSSHFAPQVAQEVSDVVHAVGLVATGFAATIVARSATSMQLPGMTYRPLHHPTQGQVDLCCIYRSDDESPILQELLSSMRKSAMALDARDL